MDNNIIAFLGRFHPLVVHLPIGILLLAGLMQIISLKSKSYAKSLNPAISFTLFWGGISSLGAIFIGWLLSLQGGYDINTLFWHKWLGILLTLLAFFAWILKSNRLKLKKIIYYLVFGLVIFLVGITGHLGGNLTHGESYLIHYAPNFIKKLVGAETTKSINTFKGIHPDSIQVYPYLIQPIFDKKCNSCHNLSKKEGGLLLTSHKAILEGGDHGSIINTRNPFESELINRITLPKSHTKFMPPKGDPLTFGEIQLIEWWMQSGADSISKFSNSKNMSTDLIKTLIRDYQLDYSPKPYYEKVIVDSLSSTTQLELQKNQFVVDFMGENSNMISVTYKGDSLGKPHMEKLLLAKDQITWLNLSNSKIYDSSLNIIESFTNMTRLNLHSNPITDEGMTNLLNLKHLNSVNIYNTKITKEGIEQLLELPSLKKLYIWKTDISSEEIKELKNKFTHIEIVGNLN